MVFENTEFLKTITPVILAGGVGRRLWPLSCEGKPKPFLRFWGRKSLFQKTLVRANDCATPLVVCNQNHRGHVLSQLPEEIFKSLTLLLEPVGRNTAPAIAAAAHWMVGKKSQNLMLVLPSDHVITDEAAFISALQKAAPVAQEGRLVTFGITPRRAETGFGYIKHGALIGNGAYDVAAFVEKPDKLTAQNFLQDGHYDWNSGIFLFKPSVFLGILAALDEPLHQGAQDSVAYAGRYNNALYLKEDAFVRLPDISVDKAVMERTDRCAVVPASMGWNDVGTWPSFLRSIFR